MKIQMIATIRASQNAESGVSLGYLFSPGTEVTIGREIGNTIAPLIDSLSRHHAKLYTKDGDWYVEDVGSTNGSFLDGAKLEAATKLANGSKLQFGTLTASVELVQEDGAATPAPAAAPAPAPKPASMTPAEAAAAGAAAAAQVAKQPTIMTKPTIPGLNSAAVTPGKPVLPTGLKSAAAPAPVDDVPDLPPVEPEKPAAAPAAAPKPAAPALKPGLKLPPKPALGGGIKLPPKPALGAGIKLPPKPGLAGGLKLPPKPALGAGIKLPPKP